MKKARKQGRAVVTIEAMESRTFLSTYAVTTIADSGAGSLRQAITDANNNAGTDTITFAIGSGAKTITPTSKLPGISGPTILNATTQPGYAGKPLIELNGSRAGSGSDGLKITGGGTTIRGLIINKFSGSGIFIYSKGGNKIAGNFIGTNNTGTAAAGNAGLGIIVQSAGNTIGGTSVADRNVISGNVGSGVYLYGAAASSNTVVGNYVGTDLTGTKAVANKNGVQVNGGANNIVGGTLAGSRNVISGNLRDGVLIVTSGSTGNKVMGNYIGTTAAGTGRLGNSWYGVEVSQANNVIGGNISAARNIISANGMAGVALYLSTGVNNRVEGNYIGTDYTGTKDLGNTGSGIDFTNGAKNNMVGGTAAGTANLIAGNDLAGVGIYNSSSYNSVVGNIIGIGSNGYAIPNAKNGVVINTGSSNNTIKSNRIAYSGVYKAVQISSGSASQEGTNTQYGNVTLGLKLV